MENKKRIYGPMQACEEYWESLPDEFYWGCECDRSTIEELVKWRKRTGATQKKIAGLAGFDLADFRRIESGERKATHGEATRIDDALIKYQNVHITAYGKLSVNLYYSKKTWRRKWNRFVLTIPSIIVVTIFLILFFLKIVVFPEFKYNPIYMFCKLLDWGSSFAVPVGFVICFGHWLYRYFKREGELD